MFSWIILHVFSAPPGELHFEGIPQVLLLEGEKSPQESA